MQNLQNCYQYWNEKQIIITKQCHTNNRNILKFLNINVLNVNTITFALIQQIKSQLVFLENV